MEPRPEVNADFIRMIANEFFPAIQGILAKLDEPYAEELYEQMLEKSRETKIAYSPLTQRDPAEYLLERFDDPATSSRQIMWERVVRNVMTTAETNGDVYNQKRVEQAVDYVMGLKKNANASEQELSRAAYARLKKGKSDKRKASGKRAVMDSEHIDIKNRLLGVE